MSIFNFWKSQKDVKKLIGTTENVIKEKPLEEYNYWWSEEQILEEEENKMVSLLSENRHFFEQIIIPTIQYAQEIGFNENELREIIVKGYKLFKSAIDGHLTIPIYIQNEENKYYSKLVSSLSHSFYKMYNKTVITEELRDFRLLKLHESLWNLHIITAETREEYRKAIKTTISKHKANECVFKQWLGLQFSMVFFKIFIFLDYQIKILTHIDFDRLTTILFEKTNDWEAAEEAAYEYLVDEQVLQDDNREKSCYKVFCDCFCVTAPVGADAYNEYIENELLINTNKVLVELIEDRNFYYYDKEKLVRAKIALNVNPPKKIIDILTEIFNLKSLDKMIEKLRIKQALSKDITPKRTINIDLLTGVEFENFLCLLFEKDGYMCQKTKATGDQGIDIIATKEDSVVAIQAKRYSSAVGNHAIMEAVAGKNYYKADICMVITNNIFTSAAIELARANNVILWDRAELLNRMKSLEEN